MHLLLVISILLRVAGIAYSVALWRRLKDWRIGILTAMLVLMASRQMFTLVNEIGHPHASLWGHASEIPAILASLLTLITVFFVGQMLIEKHQAVDALRMSEHRFSKAFRYTPDAISISRLDDGLIVDVNEGFEDITGYSREEAIGRTVADLGLWEDKESRNEFLTRIRKHGRIRDFETLIHTRSGRRVSCQTSSETFNLSGRTHVVSIARDVSESRQRQRELIEAIEGEQRRIGHDLHDSLAQDLVSVALQLQLVVNAAKNKTSAPVLSVASVNERLKLIIENTRRMAQGLSPVDLEQGGLSTAMRRYCENISEMHGIECRYRCDPLFPPLRGATSLHLYRIAQEAASNAIRHSRCRALRIELARIDDQLALTVEDDGVGIEDRAHAAGMGLSIMDYRAKALGGVLTCTPRRSGGTTVRCVFPFELSVKARRADAQQSRSA